MDQPNGPSSIRSLWLRFRGLPTRVQAGAWVVVAVALIVAASLGAGGSGAPTVHSDAGGTTTTWALPAPATVPAVDETTTITTESAPTTTAAAPPTTSTQAPAPAGGASAGGAVSLLASLQVAPAASTAGYSRDLFGPAWADVDHNGCDTRNDILNRDLTAKTWKAGTYNCVVMSGTLADPYTGRTIAFVKADADAVQIDHVVALADAWQTGAQAWSGEMRERYANDPLVLLAVDGPTNQAKGDGDASEWLPPNQGFRCPYVTRQVQIKAVYHLWVTPAEHDAMASVLASCPGGAPAATATTAPSATAPATTPPPVAATPAPAPTAPAPTAPSAPAGGTSEVYYANCDAARAAGAAPILRGQPGYRSTLDRDGDGVACET